MSQGKQSATPGPGTDGSLLITPAMLSCERTNVTKRMCSGGLWTSEHGSLLGFSAGPCLSLVGDPHLPDSHSTHFEAILLSGVSSRFP